VRGDGGAVPSGLRVAGRAQNQHCSPRLHYCHLSPSRASDSSESRCRLSLSDFDHIRLEAISFAREVSSTAIFQHGRVLGDQHSVLVAFALSRVCSRLGCRGFVATSEAFRRWLVPRMRLRPPRHARALPGVRNGACPTKLPQTLRLRNSLCQTLE
jgi:hypothetical protein